MINDRRVIEYFSKELTRRMNTDGLKDRDISTYCCISEENLRGYRCGERLPNPWYLVMMSEFLECSVNDLLGFSYSDDYVDFESAKASRVFSSENQFELYLGRRIDSYMNKRRISINMLSMNSGISIDTIKHWLGKHPRLPRTTQLLRVCDALDCTPSDLLGY